MTDKYTLIYWPGIPGRGEFIRLMFEYTGTAYKDETDPEKTPNIMSYLGEDLGLSGESKLDAYMVNQLTLTLLDLNNEAHDTHHPVAVSEYYEDQKEHALVKAKDFRGNRLPKFLKYFEGVLQDNKEPDYLVGKKVTYADLTLQHVLAGLQFAFPKRMKTLSNEIPLCLALKEKIESDERIRDYLASSRRQKFSMGVYRYYAELDDA